MLQGQRTRSEALQRKEVAAINASTGKVGDVSILIGECCRLALSGARRFSEVSRKNEGVVAGTAIILVEGSMAFELVVAGTTGQLVYGTAVALDDAMGVGGYRYSINCGHLNILFALKKWAGLINVE